ncbi:unnamed protein product [Cuscuta campestris]|uniref:Uncharacterized protein n=1 Tax=Cuscuta campestris TaxID=132261 RepID=A0A484KQZ7_9ASTE|nr:unnamed protein product [Cuscuta campestris]
MSVESSSLRASEAEHVLGLGNHGSVAQDDRAEQLGSPSIEEIAAVEVPGVTEPRLQKRTLLVDSLICGCKCDLSGDEFLKAVRYAGPLVTVRRPTPEESVFDVPPGYFAIHLKSLESGFRFPLESLVIDFFKYFEFLPCQLVPNSHQYFAGFLIRCREMGVRADLEGLLTLFRVAKSSGSDGGSFTALCQWQERLFKTKKESNKTWKSKFVFVSVGSASPFRDAPLSSFRWRSKPFASSKAIADMDKLCLGGPYEPGSLVKTEALAELGFVSNDQDEPKHRVVQSQLEEGPSGGHAHPRAGGALGVARIAAEEKARRLEEESEHAIEAFHTTPAFEEAALSRMDDLLKIWAQTPDGKRLLIKEGQANYSLGLHRAQEVLLERIRDGKELPKPCKNPEEFDSAIYYSEDEDATGGGEDTAVCGLALAKPCSGSYQRGRVRDLHLGKISGYGLRSAFLPRRSVGRECLRPSSRKNIRKRFALGLPSEEERRARVFETFIRGKHPGMPVDYRSVGVLDLPVCLWVPNRRIAMLDTPTFKEVVEGLGLELCPIVCDYVLGYAEAADDLLCEKLLALSSGDARQWGCLRPLGEVVDGYNDVPYVPCTSRKRTHEVHPPPRERDSCADGGIVC